MKNLLKTLKTLARIDVKDFRLRVPGQIAAKVESLQRLDLIAQPRGLLEEEGLARLLHLGFHLLKHRFLLAFEEKPETADVRPIALAVDPLIARRGALIDRVE